MATVNVVVTTKDVEAADDTKAGNGGQSAQAPIEKLNQGTSGNNMVMTSAYVNQLCGLGKQALKTAFNYAKSNYGNFTGDYIGQTKIDNAYSIAETLLSVGSSIVSGAMTGGVVGAVVGAAVSLGSLAINYSTSEATYQYNLTKQNAAASYNASRIGAILTNGNR